MRHNETLAADFCDISDDKLQDCALPCARGMCDQGLHFDLVGAVNSKETDVQFRFGHFHPEHLKPLD